MLLIMLEQYIELPGPP